MGPAPQTDPSSDSEEELFHAALALPFGERAGFLARSAPPGLARRLTTLLAAHDSAGEFLNTPIIREPTPVGHLGPGVHIDHYILRESLGEGGWGVVFRAEQTRPLRRQVALKVIKLGMDTQEVITRFATERQALALLDHPGIARVYDAGTTAAGRPYFVMELVAGTKITTYCDTHRLTLSARLGLFLAVCEAVEHAHQKGVIHRDLKPSNILVVHDVSKPQPKVIDFGVAKAVTGRLADQTLTTAYGTFIGTLGYVSPEQSESTGHAVDTRSDIYSLGVLLHELLTGRLPFSPTSSTEFLRQLREDPPGLPSSTLRLLSADEGTRLAGQRDLAPKALVRALAGDLDWIMLRCLEKEPARRYATAGNLAADIRRHLEHLPVEARPPGRLYILARFIRRHQATSAVVLVSVILLATATAVSLRLAWLARRANAQAQTEAAASRRMAAFLQEDLLGPASQHAQPIWDLRWRGVLDQAGERITLRFPDQPAVASALHATLAADYQTLGDFDSARKHYAQSLALRTKAGLPDDDESLRATDGLVWTLSRLNRGPEAEALLRSTLARIRRTQGAESPLVVHLEQILAVCLAGQKKSVEAEQLARHALVTRLARNGPAHPNTFGAWQSLALVHREARQFDLALDCGTRALVGLEKTLGAENPATLEVMSTLAAIYRSIGRYPESEQLNHRLIALRTRSLGADHPDTLTALAGLATVYQDLGRYADAAALVEREAQSLQQALGPEHPITLGAWTSLAYLQQIQGRYAEAIELHRRILATRRRTWGSDNHPDIAASLLGIGVSLRLAGRLAEAEPVLAEATQLRDRLLGPEHHETLIARDELAASQLQQSHWADAEQNLRLTVPAHHRTEPNFWRTPVADSLLGDALAGQARYAEAEVLLLSAERELRPTDAPDGSPLGIQWRDAVLRLEKCYAARGQATEAARWRDRRVAAERSPADSARTGANR